MKRFAVSSLIFFIALFVAVPVVLYLQRNSRPTIICGSLDDSIRPRNYCLMNPYRDKQPEKFAEAILQELKNGNTEIIIPYLKEDSKNRILESEKKFRVENWRIGNREDSEDKVFVSYWVSRRDYYDGHLEDVSFLFEREGIEWKLIQINAGY